MIYVGIDPSLTGTGVCVLGDGCATVTTIKTKPGDFANMYRRIDHIVTEITSMPGMTDAFCCIEAPFMHAKNKSNAMSIHALAYMVRRKMSYTGIPFKDVAATQLKKFITGKGNVAGKDMIAKEVFKRYGIDCEDNNQADAVVLAHIAKAIKDVDAELTAYQRDVIVKL